MPIIPLTNLQGQGQILGSTLQATSTPKGKKCCCTTQSENDNWYLRPQQQTPNDVQVVVVRRRYVCRDTATQVRPRCPDEALNDRVRGCKCGSSLNDRVACNCGGKCKGAALSGCGSKYAERM
ncbi:MAG: hypothetical protein JNL32_00235 [Candidatus Kapabacteria bacterium]|nr:hypothetical protein [Candidatus Kapabacteria bacterium]